MIHPMATATAKDLDRTLRLFRALGDETRLRLLERLKAGEQCVCNLTDDLESRQSLLSFHLKTLKDAGLVTDRRDGRWIYYSLNRATLDEIRGAIDDLGAAPRASLGSRRRC
jgi:ArsR family transcriptional regulator, arsenate/arsenite/antimonite-responsive transcriptional repressor